MDWLAKREGGEDDPAAPEAAADSRPVPGGCDIRAVIPWKRLGYDAMPGKVLLEVIVYSVDPVTDGICHARAFDWPRVS